MHSTEFLLQYHYVFLFIGMIFFGETVFIPALYLAFSGVFTVFGVLIVTFLATLFADGMWYLIGLLVPLHRIKKISRMREGLFDRLSALFDKSGWKIIILSKFVYGTRIIAQVLSGIKKMNFTLYLLSNIIGVLLYFSILTVIVRLIYIGLAAASFLSVTKYSFVIFVLIMILISWGSRRVTRRWL